MELAPFDDSLALIVDIQLAQLARKLFEELSYWDDRRRLTKVTNNHIAIPVNAECKHALLSTERLQGNDSFLHTSHSNKDGDEGSKMGIHQSAGLAEPTGLWKPSSSERGVQYNKRTQTDPPCCSGSLEQAQTATLPYIDEVKSSESGSRPHLPSALNDASECFGLKCGFKHSVTSSTPGHSQVIWSGRMFDIEAKLVCIDLPLSKKAKLTTPYDRLRMMIEGWVKEGVLHWKEELGKEIPKNWERHGDLVLLPSSCFLDPAWTAVSDIWSSVASTLNCTRIARRGRIQSDDFRSPRTDILLGSDPFVEHRDNGIIYTFDIRYSMFSSGNITEKLRIASLDCSKETVVDLYAGIGYFTLPYLVHAKAKLVYACEWNPHAVKALHTNLKLNSVNERCIVLEGDNRKVCPVGVADRVNLGLIPLSEQGWPVACAALNPKTGGVLHIHGNVDSYPHKEWSDPSDSKCLGNSSSNSDPCSEDYAVSSITDECVYREDSERTAAQPQTESRDFTPVMAEDTLPEDSMACSTQVYTGNTLQGQSGSGMDITGNTLQGQSGSGMDITGNTLQGQSGSGMDITGDILQGQSGSGMDITGNTLQGQSGSGMDISSSCSSNKELNVRGFETREESQDNDQGFCVSDLFDKKLSENCFDFKQGKWMEWGCLAVKKIKELLCEQHGNNWSVEMVHIEHVKSYAPHIHHLVLDLNCKPVS